MCAWLWTRVAVGCRSNFTLLVGLVLFSAVAFAQNRGAISGTILDSTGASIPAAKVVVKAPEIGLERDTKSNEAGFFTVPTLP